MRAIRFLCVSREWFRVNWHLHGATPASVESASRPRSWQPPEQTSSKREGALTETGPNEDARQAESGQPLDHHGHALPAAHAHRLQAERLVVELEAVQQGGGDPGPGHAERVPDRDRSAVDV